MPGAGPAYGAFWRRLAAFLIDWMLLGAAEVFLGLVVLVVAPDALARVAPVSAAIAWAYFALMESSPAQATLGKIALDLKVTDLDGGVITFRRASFRYWFKTLSTLTLGIGWLLAAFSPRRQALHDLLARTVVVRNAVETAATPHWDPRVPGFHEEWDGARWVPPAR